MSTGSERLVGLYDLITVASEHGLHVTLGGIRAAVRAGELEPHQEQPLRFTVRAANAWLTELAHQRGVRLPGSKS
jgi:hypothetical protein